MKIKDLIQYWRYVSFSFRGRINRTCWWLHLFLTYPFLFLAGAYFYYEEGTTDTIFGVIVLLFGLILYYTHIPSSVKRLHDTSRSGWNLLWGIVPIIGPLYILIVCGFFKGAERDNWYGVNPTGTENDNEYEVHPIKIDWLKKFIPYLLLWVGVSLIVDPDSEVFFFFIVCLILVVNPIVLPKVWKFILERIKEVSKAVRGED